MLTSKDQNFRRFQGNNIIILLCMLSQYLFNAKFWKYLVFLSLPYGTGPIFYINLWCYLSIMICNCFWKCKTQINYFELWSLVLILQLQTLARCIHEVLSQTWKTRTILIMNNRFPSILRELWPLKIMKAHGCNEILLCSLKMSIDFILSLEQTNSRFWTREEKIFGSWLRYEN